MRIYLDEAVWPTLQISTLQITSKQAILFAQRGGVWSSYVMLVVSSPRSQLDSSDLCCSPAVCRHGVAVLIY